MKNCIFAIFYYNPFLDKQCEKIDKKIESLALNTTQPCSVLYKKIISLSQRKNQLINLRVLYNCMVEQLTKEEIQAVSIAAKKPLWQKIIVIRLGDLSKF